MLYKNDVPEPIAMRVSILGFLLKRCLNPLIKNFLPVNIIGITSRSSVSARRSFPPSPVNDYGNGALNIPPIPKYISGTMKINETIALSLSSVA